MAKEIILPFSELKGTLVDTPNEPTLEITENGVYNVKGYVYADVNVEGGGGSSDFSTAKVTVVNNAQTLDIYMPYAYYDEYQGEVTSFASSMWNVYSSTTDTKDAILYNGSCEADFTGASSATISIEGDATESDGYVLITGDCTITLTSK